MSTKRNGKLLHLDGPADLIDGLLQEYYARLAELPLPGRVVEMIDGLDRTVQPNGAKGKRLARRDH